ncbi:MAG: signal peptidase I [Phycisphaerae bacterium]
MKATSTRKRSKKDEGGIKDTFESILIAFILAFVFRAFVVEAFVIPTGSMAPTLLGAHMRYICPDCGYAFDVNFSGSESATGDVSVPNNAVRTIQTNRGPVTIPVTWEIYCPNTGYRLPAEAANPYMGSTQSPVFFGDRILVQKYVYLLNEPRRWDVVVFKSPQEPERYDYEQNYIKRLVGLPGEYLMMLDGDVYTAPGNIPRENLTPAAFTIQTKPAYVQQALWRVVYDNDFIPRSTQNWQQPWQAIEGTGWDTGEAGRSRVFVFDNLTGPGTLAFRPPLSSGNFPWTDWLAYNITALQTDGRGETRGPVPVPGPQDLQRLSYHEADFPPTRPATPFAREMFENVSDGKLSLFYERTAGDGPLELLISKEGTRFTAEITPDTATLFMTDEAGNRTRIGTAGVNAGVGDVVKLDLVSVDYRVALHVNGMELIATTPQQFSPDVAALLSRFDDGEESPVPEVRISAKDQQARISHVSVWRDIFYRSRVKRERSVAFWASPKDFPANLVRLGDDEFFVAGDNSPISGDARMWTDPVNLPAEGLFAEAGRVPGRFLLGRAFFVYWPAGYRIRNSPPSLVPNFGQMRFIH